VLEVSDWVDTLRLINTLTGCAAFGLLVYRLVGRWQGTSWLSRIVVALLAAAELVLGLGAARAAQIHATFNELAWAVLGVNVATCVVGIVWHRLLDPSGRRH
jgi:hypothetical protein